MSSKPKIDLIEHFEEMFHQFVWFVSLYSGPFPSANAGRHSITVSNDFSESNLDRK